MIPMIFLGLFVSVVAIDNLDEEVRSPRPRRFVVLFHAAGAGLGIFILAINLINYAASFAK